MNWARHEAGLTETREAFPDQGDMPRRSIPASSTPAASSARRLEDGFPGRRRTRTRCARCSRAYVETKQRQNVLDYDDLLLYFAQMLAEPGIAAEIAGRFDHLLVDEYQDTNALQAEIVLALRPQGRGLTVVGDDAQSIYSFRAATVRNILDFPQSFRSAGARGHARAQLSLDAADARRRQRRHRARAGALRQGPVDRPRRMGALPALVTRRRRGRSGAVRRDARARQSRGGRERSSRRRCCFAPPTTAPRSSSN